MQDLYALLPVVGIFLVFWLLVLRPASRRQKAMRELQSQLVVGDEVLTNAGIFGTIARLEDDRVGLEVAEGVVITLARPAIVGVTQREADTADTAAGGQSPVDDTVNGQE